MTTEWKELKTLQEVAAAQAAGEEIQCDSSRRDNWVAWSEGHWDDEWFFRSRPRKQTKTVVLREALCRNGEYYWTGWASMTHPNFVRWLDTPERTVEVEL